MNNAEGYRLIEGLPYRPEPPAQDSGGRCRLDLYIPQDVADFATVVWFHGGGLREGFRYVPGELREQGIAVAAAGYRLSPEVRAPAYIEDAAAAVAWVFRNIGRYGGSEKKVFLAGASAGAYLALLVALDRRWLDAHGIDANRIAGVISVTGQAITHFAVRAERGIGERKTVVDDLAPLFHVRADAPPVLLITGDRELELLGRYEENAYFLRMLKLAGHPSVDLIELPGRDHAAVESGAHAHLLRFVRGVAGAPPEAGTFT